MYFFNIKFSAFDSQLIPFSIFSFTFMDIFFLSRPINLQALPGTVELAEVHVAPCRTEIGLFRTTDAITRV